MEVQSTEERCRKSGSDLPWDEGEYSALIDDSFGRDDESMKGIGRKFGFAEERVEGSLERLDLNELQKKMRFL